MSESANRTELTQIWVAIALFVLSASALLLRLLSETSNPNAPLVPSSPYETVAETFVGAGNVRIGDSGTGDLVVLLNSNQPSQRKTANAAERITEIIQSMAPDRSVTVSTANFADQTFTAPGASYLFELVILVTLAGISGWLSLDLYRRKRTVSFSDPKAVIDSVPHVTPAVTRLAKPASSTEKAAAVAKHQPEKTAKIIASWLNEEDTR
ncbi:MAG: hypothetical protein AAF683_12935 [Pseudomonadota bacterium]